MTQKSLRLLPALVASYQAPTRNIHPGDALPLTAFRRVPGVNVDVWHENAGAASTLCDQSSPRAPKHSSQAAVDNSDPTLPKCILRMDLRAWCEFRDKVACMNQSRLVRSRRSPNHQRHFATDNSNDDHQTDNCKVQFSASQMTVGVTEKRQGCRKKNTSQRRVSKVPSRCFESVASSIAGAPKLSVATLCSDVTLKCPSTANHRKLSFVVIFGQEAALALSLRAVCVSAGTPTQ